MFSPSVGWGLGGGLVLGNSPEHFAAKLFGKLLCLKPLNKEPDDPAFIKYSCFIHMDGFSYLSQLL